ncbi:PLP-dependent aminotransferase family protein [Paenibacillus sacheonensis]|uniref:Aminotransferase class I/II-fold pyridoxal phosphate-dependent enzyme n=1 Tax=Paenibacillus sacheonensis TaxID=742054 RepID=A0A7X4YNN9_9BACL|nr:PLP-dependent aminotransferase family protein [Paenibacillus sacheonensis]MBM7565354.1 2-aminoadipate transaminase [Paenibacillus sacheonensis]NBC69716.1 aminotransferase class I/II-fold pyridoxal phosphate-dependent enzyme [Paenibacillus sacheonensis]
MKSRNVRRAEGLGTASLADLLKQAGQEEFISFAGDMPADDCLPRERIMAAQIAEPAREAEDVGSSVPGSSHGQLSILERLCAFMAVRGIAADPSNTLLTTGMQQTVQLIARSLLEPGDTVLVENPTQPAVLRAFLARGLQVVPVPGDREGLLIPEAERLMQQHRPKLIYVMPSLGDPDSRLWSEDRRVALLSLSRRMGVTIWEDNRYGELLFPHDSDSAPASLYELNAGRERDGVLYTGSFSALLGPSFPAGWIISSRGTAAQLAAAQQSLEHKDSGESTAYRTFRTLERVLDECDLVEQVRIVRMSYFEKMQRTKALLRGHNLNGVSWKEPKGGMFLWVELPEGLDAEALLRSAAAKQVTFETGASFYAKDPQNNHVRLTYSNMPEEQLKSGIDRFAEAVREFLARSSP